jgi:hypothetical protein
MNQQGNPGPFGACTSNIVDHILFQRAGFLKDPPEEIHIRITACMPPQMFDRSAELPPRFEEAFHYTF